MKKIVFIMSLFLSGIAHAQLNIQLRSNLAYPSQTANIGGYVDSLGHEYALVGYWDGLSIVDVTNPDVPVEKFVVPGLVSEWREVKTYRKYAYVTTEAGNGIQIVDLSRLPDTVTYKAYTGDGATAGQISSVHALHVDTAKAYLYLYGSNISTGANNKGYSLFFNLADPWNPQYAGHFIIGAGDAYVHDGYVLNDTMWEAHIYDGFVAVVDVRDKANPVLLATQTTPNQFTHNTWLSDNHKTLFTTDETTNSFLTAYDVSDLTNISELSRFQTAPGTGAIVHNTHILNDYAVTSWYKEGVVITDESRPMNPIEVGHYDTYPQGSGSGFDGDWGVYPFLPSGNLVCSDMSNGLFVLTPTYVRGCYLEGTVTDSITTAILNGAKVEILLAANSVRNSDLYGIYRTGFATAGLYDVQFSKPGYITKTIQNVSLSNGVLTTLNAQLVPAQTFTYSGQVVDSASGIDVAGAQVELINPDFSYTSTCDGSGNFSVPSFYEGAYTISAGKWGYVTKCITQNFDSTSTPIVVAIPVGYYDDFTFDFGWTVTGTSVNLWERGEPIGTYYGNVVVNPEYDIPTDCSDKCYVTDNGGGGYNSHDVDNGYTILTSPLFDATIYTNPSIDYYHWFEDLGNGTRNDSMLVKLSNGITTVTIETISAISPGAGTWFHRNYNIASRITPTAAMQMIVYIVDVSPDHAVEGALDKFSLQGTMLNGINDMAKSRAYISVSPNPFTDATTIAYNFSSSASSTIISQGEITVTDMLGNIEEQHPLISSHGIVRVGDELHAGIYFVNVKDAEEGAKPCKL